MSERGEYRGIPIVLLDGPQFQELDAVARWVFVACKMKCGPCGIALIPGLPHAVAEWTGYDVPLIERALARLENGETPWIRRERNMLWIVGGMRNEPSRNVRNENHRAAAATYLAGLPRLALLRRFIAEHPDWLGDATKPGGALEWAAERRADPAPIPSPIPSPMVSKDQADHGNGRRKTEDGDTTAPRSRRSNPSASPKPPDPRKADLDALWQAWVSTHGAIDYGRFRKALAPLYPASSEPAYRRETLVGAITLHGEWVTGLAPGAAKWETVERWAGDVVRWARLAEMPLVEPDGTPSERARMLLGAA